MHGNRPCTRPVYVGEKCICHSEREDKDVELFHKELAKVFADEDSKHLDLTRFVFPKVGFDLPRQYEKETYFSRAMFLGDIVFLTTEFEREVHFDGAEFRGNVYFLSVRFRKEADFTTSVFSQRAVFLATQFQEAANFMAGKFSQQAVFGVTKFHHDALFTFARFFGKTRFYWVDFLKVAHFWGAGFMEEASFHGVTFAEDAKFNLAVFEGPASFNLTRLGERALVVFDAGLSKDKRMFLKGASFLSWVSSKPKQIAFRKVALQKCRFLETDMSDIRFSDVEWPERDVEWPEQGRRISKWFKRKAVYDEIAPDLKWLRWNDSENKEVTKEPLKYQYNLIAQLYRSLQANYISNYRFPEAGDFYIGEQEMMRKAKGKIRQYLCTNFFYKIISNYGESFTVPFLWLLLTLFVFPGLLLYGGINLDYDSQITDLVETVNYDWTWSPKDLLLLNNHYWKAFGANISFVTFHRSEIAKYLPEIGQTVIVNLEILLVVTLAAFFLLALRRKFKRKSF